MKYVLISGCSGGMGLETVKKFTSNGYFVFGLDIKEPKKKLDNFVFVKTDVTKEEEVKNAYKLF